MEFLDTNVLIYACHPSAGEKFRLARDLTLRLVAEGSGAISTQVLIELYSVSLKRPEIGNAVSEALIRELSDWKLHRPTHQDILDSIRVQQRYQISFFDALILNSAMCVGATILWTEDLNHGQKYGPVTVRNPFLA